MSAGGFRDIVTDGIIFQVDAANNLCGNVTNVKNIVTPTETGSFENGMGVTGSTYSFDGLDDYIDFGSITSTNPLSLYGLNEFTIEFWVKADGTGDGFQRIIDKSTAGSAANGWGIWFGVNASDNYISLTSIGSSLITDTSPRDFGNWVHYVFTKNGDDYSFWMNGELKQTNTNTTTIPSTTTNCRIGSWNHSTARELNGNMASFKIYNRALTSTEVLQNYNATKYRFI
jgi:hypothetical protein